jgi:hypothetical protein
MAVLPPLVIMSVLSRESVLKWKDQYDSPPCTNKFRSPALNTEKLLFSSLIKQFYINKEVNGTKTRLPLQLGFPGLVAFFT